MKPENIMTKRFCSGLAATCVCFLAQPVLSAPDTVASVRTRAHAEIAARDAQIALLRRQLAADEAKLATLQPTLTAVPASLPFGVSPPSQLSAMQRDTQAALNAGQVKMTADVIDVFNHTADVNLSITNYSRKLISFQTVPIMYYGNGYSEDLKVQKMDTVSFPSPGQQVQDAFSAALAGPGRGTYSGTIPLPGESPTAENTLIAPGQTLYARATCPFFGNDHTVTKFLFRGGGWDEAVVVIR